MRILWVKVGGLWPIHSGGRLRSFHILRELSLRHELSVVTTHHPNEATGALAQQLPQCKHIVELPHDPPKHQDPAFVHALLRSWFSPLPVDLYKNRVPGMQEAVRDLLTKKMYDLVIADFLTALPNVPAHTGVPVLLFSHNVEYMIWQRLCQNAGSWLRRMVLGLEWRKLRRYEQKACQRAPLTISVSDSDRRQLHQLAPAAHIEAVPTGVDTDYFKPSGLETERWCELVFCGSMDWFPNEDGMLWFMEAVLPLIRRELPAVTLTIVGRNPGLLLQRAVGVGIRLTGTVDDVRPHVERGAVYVVPLRIGGGTRLKIFEAMAMGKAIVSTTIGAEGLPLQDGKHLLLADTPEIFAGKVAALIRNPASRLRLGQAGRQLVEASYSWRRVTDDFEALCTSAVKTNNSQTVLTPRGSNP